MKERERERHESPNEVTLIELTLGFETAFEAGVQRKTDKYLELIGSKQRLQSRDYDN